MISVCLATFNGDKYIKRQIDSILQQLGAEDELIISDDGSTDKTLHILNDIIDSRICILPFKKFNSAIRNFEYILTRAKGDIIFLSDQDDIWLPGKLDKMLFALMQTDLVLSDCIVVDQNDNIIHNSFFKHRQSKPGFWVNLWKNSYMGCCMAFRREVLMYTLPFPKNIHMHDWWIGLMVEYNGKVLFLHEPLLKYVRHGENVSPTGQGKHSWSKRLVNRFWMGWYVLYQSLTQNKHK